MTSIALMIALFLSALTAGFLVAFAVVVMPGLKPLDDASYLRAFQLMDGVIQNRQPLFMLMWVGSLLATLAAVVVGVGALSGVDQILLLGAGALYLGGVHLPTVTINIPLNNQVQRLRIHELEPGALREARAAFETRWNRWNAIRTVVAAVSVMLMLLLLVRL
jgi:uncharacterized membrane protein